MLIVFFLSKPLDTSHLAYNRLEFQFRSNDNIDESAETAHNMMSLRDGKLSLNFFKAFYSNVLLKDISSKPLKNLYDLRVIALYNYHNMLEPYKTSDAKLPDIYKLRGAYDPYKPIYIHTQERFLQDIFAQDINNIYGMNVILTSIDKKDEAPCIKAMRAELSARSFTGARELHIRIEEFNHKMYAKFLTLASKLSSTELNRTMP